MLVLRELSVRPASELELAFGVDRPRPRLQHLRAPLFISRSLLSCLLSISTFLLIDLRKYYVLMGRSALYRNSFRNGGLHLCANSP